jgi:hypothetical protein
MQERDRIEAIELAPTGERKGRSSDPGGRPKLPGPADTSRKVAKSVLVAIAIEGVDAGGSLPANAAAQTTVLCCERARGRATPKAERSCFSSSGVPGVCGINSVDRNDAADRF